MALCVRAWCSRLDERHAAEITDEGSFVQLDGAKIPPAGFIPAVVSELPIGELALQQACSLGQPLLSSRHPPSLRCC